MSRHCLDSVELELQAREVRKCLSVEELIYQLIQNAWFDPVLLYGLDGNEWQEGADVRELMRQSFEASF